MRNLPSARTSTHKAGLRAFTNLRHVIAAAIHASLLERGSHALSFTPCPQISDSRCTVDMSFSFIDLNKVEISSKFAVQLGSLKFHFMNLECN